MTVADLIKRLQDFDQDMLVGYPSRDSVNLCVEVSDLMEDTITYGLLLPEPTTHRIVILSNGYWPL